VRLGGVWSADMRVACSAPAKWISLGGLTTAIAEFQPPKVIHIFPKPAPPASPVTSSPTSPGFGKEEANQSPRPPTTAPAQRPPTPAHPAREAQRTALAPHPPGRAADRNLSAPPGPRSGPAQPGAQRGASPPPGQGAQHRRSLTSHLPNPNHSTTRSAVRSRPTHAPGKGSAAHRPRSAPPGPRSGSVQPGAQRGASPPPGQGAQHRRSLTSRCSDGHPHRLSRLQRPKTSCP
jgi:hypothetical protein